jgi:hypothetical protein
MEGHANGAIGVFCAVIVVMERGSQDGKKQKEDENE